MEGLVIAKVEDFPTKRSERPPCPECGSNYIVSRFPEWRCMDCGRAFMQKWDRKKTSQNTTSPETHK